VWDFSNTRQYNGSHSESIEADINKDFATTSVFENRPTLLMIRSVLHKSTHDGENLR
jgi:hypothetical protein